MSTKKRYNIKNILLATLWISIGTGIVVLLVAAIRKKDGQPCRGIDISISGVNNNFFVDKTDILNAITVISNGNPVGKTTGSLNLKMMETQLEKNTWVKHAELFLDNNAMLHVNVQEREPIARVFSVTGTSFYIDADIAVLPLSEKFSARLPVFTNFPVSDQQLTKADSNLLTDIKIISLAIQKDSFRMAMIDQVDITPQRSFEMIPKIGNQVIVFGDATAAEDKFRKLQLFYTKVMVKAGWNNYSVINLQYRGQVVAKRRGAEDVTADSMRTLLMMQMIVNNAEKQAGDSLQTHMQDNDNTANDSSMIQQSIQRDENTETPTATETTTQPITQPVLNSSTNTPTTVLKKDPIPKQKPKPAVVKKPAAKPIVIKPKAAMPKRNDYRK